MEKSGSKHCGRVGRIWMSEWGKREMGKHSDDVGLIRWGGSCGISMMLDGCSIWMRECLWEERVGISMAVASN